MPDPIDTSTLGPVRADPDRVALRAKLVRDAIRAALALDPDPEVRHAARWVADRASDVTLAQLYRLLN